MGGAIIGPDAKLRVVVVEGCLAAWNWHGTALAGWPQLLLHPASSAQAVFEPRDTAPVPVAANGSWFALLCPVQLLSTLPLCPPPISRQLSTLQPEPPLPQQRAPQGEGSGGSSLVGMGRKGEGEGQQERRGGRLEGGKEKKRAGEEERWERDYHLLEFGIWGWEEGKSEKGGINTKAGPVSDGICPCCLFS